MTNRLVLALLSLALWFGPLASHGQVQQSDLVAICGDSITEQRLYSVFIEDYLTMCLPEQTRPQVMQFGWSGETSWGFLARMENDVLAFKPTVVTTCYGMNDGGYTAPDPNRLQRYRQAMDSIVETFKKASVRTIVVGSPGAVDPATFKRADSQVYNQTLARLRDVARQVASQHQVLFADVHATMLQVMADAKARFGQQYHVAGPDGFHPAANGHLVMAYAFLKALGCDGHIGTITLDMASGKAEATEGHRIVQCNTTSATVQSARYPFCFYGEPNNPNSTAGIVECFGFNQDLNRFMLMVKNPPAARLKVTWGQDSRSFPAASLEDGINLAAEFLENPFSTAFRRVEELVRRKQAFETTAIKQLQHSIPQWLMVLPDTQQILAQLTQKIVEKDKALREASMAAVVPVTHTIRVEPEAP